MRGTVCKRYRRLAREHSIGMPERQLFIKNHQSIVFIGDQNAPTTRVANQVFNYPKSTRAIYRAFKNGGYNA